MWRNGTDSDWKHRVKSSTRHIGQEQLANPVMLGAQPLLLVGRWWWRRLRLCVVRDDKGMLRRVLVERPGARDVEEDRGSWCSQHGCPGGVVWWGGGRG